MINDDETHIKLAKKPLVYIGLSLFVLYIVAGVWGVIQTPAELRGGYMPKMQAYEAALNEKIAELQIQRKELDELKNSIMPSCFKGRKR